MRNTRLGVPYEQHTADGVRAAGAKLAADPRPTGSARRRSGAGRIVQERDARAG
ncbi:hypothetical protein ACIBQX_45775 [Nonomuraea sp. NPDC049714]|uniref:hypothetical protein n=1 Tax=Nonomuraea sp. NPDC049714 TaxID=3364357 RepID=UPI0037A2C669